jgi:uncharacterized protein
MPPRTLFADAFYWIAQHSPRDAFYAAVSAFNNSLGSALLVTTEEVLTEFLNHYSGAGRQSRLQAALTVRDIRTDPQVEVVPQSSAGFADALDLYETRPDKGYSLTDCRSMLVMRDRGLTEVLTHDGHFSQEGFTILFP